MNRSIIIRTILKVLILNYLVDSVSTNTSSNHSFSDTIIPEKYSLWLNPFFDNFTFSGQVSIEFSVVNSTSELQIISNDLEFIELALISTDLLSNVVQAQLESRNNITYISVDTPLSGSYNLNITFTGTVNNVRRTEGMFYNVYLVGENDTFYMATNTKNYDECRIFPCLNDPKIPVKFIVNIARSENQTSISNAIRNSSNISSIEMNSENKVWDSFEEITKISPIEIGITVHELDSLTNLSYTMWTNPDRIDQSVFANSYLPKVANCLQDWIGEFSLPMKKLDVVVLPDSCEETVHYPGLVFGRESEYLFMKSLSSAKHQEDIVHSLVNVIVKQLFSPQKFNEDWLIQGITKYLDSKIVSKLEVSWLTSQRLCTDTLAFLEIDRNTQQNHKVAAIFYMAERIFSEETIKRALLTIAKTGDFLFLEDVLTIFNESSTEDNITLQKPDNITMFTFLHQWLLQPGYPVIRVDKSESLILIEQEDILGNNLTWPIYLAFATQHGDVAVSNALWMTRDKTEVQLSFNQSFGWIILKDNQEGFYRINYDSENWQLLIDQLMRNHSQLSVVSRSRLLDDAFYLAKAGYLEYSMLFNLCQYLVNETDYIVWTTASRNFEKYILMFHGTELATDFQIYVRELYSAFYNSSHRMFSAEESHIKKLSRLHVLHWACHWNLPTCVDFTKSLFKQWISSSVGFPNEYKPAALCSGVKYFAENFYDVVDSLTESELDFDRRVHIAALACTVNSTHLQYLLKTAFLNKYQMIFGHNDKFYLLKEVVKHHENIEIVVQFLIVNFDIIRDRSGGELMSSILELLEESLSMQQNIQFLTELQNSSLPIQLQQVFNSSLTKAKSLGEELSKIIPLVASALQNLTTQSHPAADISSSAISLPFIFNLLVICLLCA